MNIKPMKSYRLTKPADCPRAGQGPLPAGFQYISGSDVKELPWGSVVQARAKCGYPFEFDENEQKFVAHIDFLKQRKRMFEPIKNN